MAGNKKFKRVNTRDAICFFVFHQKDTRARENKKTLSVEREKKYRLKHRKRERLTGQV